MAELKKCPFCGGEVEIFRDIMSGFYRIKCRNNLCTVRPTSEWRIAKLELINQWNDRVTEAEIRAKAISVMGMAMKEAYPTHKANYVEFDVFFRDVMLKVAEQLKEET